MRIECRVINLFVTGSHDRGASVSASKTLDLHDPMDDLVAPPGNNFPEDYFDYQFQEKSTPNKSKFRTIGGLINF